MGTKVIYAVHAALTGMARARALTAAATMTLALALFVMGSFGMALGAARDVVRAWGEGGHVSCALREGVAEHLHEPLRARIAAWPGVKEAQLLDPAASLSAFAARGPQARALVEGVDPTILPVALVVTPRGSVIDGVAIERLAEALAAEPELEDIAYNGMQLQRARGIIRMLALIAVGLGGLLAAAVVFMVANTIRLMIYAREEEVRILRLVGATSWFIRAPFYIEGLTWGLLAGLLGGAGLYGAQWAFKDLLAQAQQVLGLAEPLRAMSPAMLLTQLGVGMALGLFGSAIALRRLLGEEAA
jgi:cell division transport system permease protein